MEIEKKYLVASIPEKVCRYPHSRLTQAYISRDPVIRIRKSVPLLYDETSNTEVSCQEKAYYRLTVKGGGLAVRQEYELDLTSEQFEKLQDKTEGKIIEKVRYKIPLADGHTAELDRFEKGVPGLDLVEVEFKSEEEMNAFEPPAWFGEDVTMDGRYQNSVLSK